MIKCDTQFDTEMLLFVKNNFFLQLMETTVLTVTNIIMLDKI